MSENHNSRGKRGPLIIGKGMSPAMRFGYEPCPSCGGRKEKSSNSRALNGPVKCADPFHEPQSHG